MPKYLLLARPGFANWRRRADTSCVLMLVRFFWSVGLRRGPGADILLISQETLQAPNCASSDGTIRGPTHSGRVAEKQAKA
jgi:hypothetical protein